MNPDLLQQVLGAIAPPTRQASPAAKPTDCFCCNDTGLIETGPFIRYFATLNVALDPLAVKTGYPLHCRRPGCYAKSPADSGIREVAPDLRDQSTICQGIHDVQIQDQRYWASPEGQQHLADLKHYWATKIGSIPTKPGLSRAIPTPILTEQEALEW